jgi:putative PIN family toxin of toxin-antitoxin system
MRIVIDTNVLLSGLMLPASIPGHVVRAALTGDVSCVSSEELHAELSRALFYPRVRSRVRLADEELQRFLAELRYVVEFVDIGRARVHVPRDRGDDAVLGTFVASRAEYLVSGDDDLLSLRPRYAVLTAREFYERHLL